MNMAYTIPPLFFRAWADQMLSRRHLSRCPWVRVLYLGLLKLQHLVDSLQKNVADQKEKNIQEHCVLFTSIKSTSWFTVMHPWITLCFCSRVKRQAEAI